MRIWKETSPGHWLASDAKMKQVGEHFLIVIDGGGHASVNSRSKADGEINRQQSLAKHRKASSRSALKAELATVRAANKAKVLELACR